MRVLALEPHTHGHHGPYLSWMARGLAERGFEINVVTLPETAELSAIRTNPECGRGNGRVSVRFTGAPRSVSLPSGGTDGAVGLVARELAYWRLFRAWYKAHAETVRPDVVFLPYLDYCLYAIGLLGSPFGSCPWAGLAMRPSFHYRQMGIRAPEPALAGVKKALFFRVARNPYLKRLLTIDEPLATYAAANRHALEKVTYFPEPAELGELPLAGDAKRNFGFEQARKVILLYGSLTARKGVVELLRALAAPGFPGEVDVLLAGRVAEPGIREILGAPWVQALRDQGRLKVIDRFIEPEEEPALFAAADIVWLGYRAHYASSGVLAQAAAARRPVIACEEGIIGWQTRRHGLGEVINPQNPAAICKAVAVLLKRGPVQPSGATTQYPSRSTFSNACDTLAAAMIEGAGGKVVGASNEI